MTPIQRYQRSLRQEGFRSDPAQAAAVDKLQDLYSRLIQKEEALNQRADSWFSRLFSKPEHHPEQGLYFWGGVGRGKTFLMDCFYESLPFTRKRRTHFHRFMQRVHHELKALEGSANPLSIIAGRYAEQAIVICFDEFFVTDIGDAMILSGLLDALFKNGVTLVCTSNIVPDGLYKDGLQRARFLPAIDLLNKYLEVVHLDGGVDYRLRKLEQAELYHHPLDAAAFESLRHSFEVLNEDAPDIDEHQTQLEINHRTLCAEKIGEGIVWFEFVELCDGPRGSEDYIELAREFHTVILANVPAFNADSDDKARRFINLVDEFYDRRVKLIVSAEAPIHQLYREGRLAFEFERTESRLLEMQSTEYLKAEHRA